GACYRQLLVKNHGLEPVETSLLLHFAADYADIFEVRGMKRKARGTELPPEVAADRVVLGYRGLDRVVRRTVLQFDPAPALLTAHAARSDLALRPRQGVTFVVTAGCERGPPRGAEQQAAEGRAPAILSFEGARAEAEADLERYRAWSCHLRTSNGQINAWV